MSDQYPPQNPYGQQPGGPQYGGPPQGGQPPYGQPPHGRPPYGQPSSGPGGEPPLWAPWYGISFPKAFVRFFKKYVAFSGRASRSEFWWVVLWSVVISIVISLIGGGFDSAAGTKDQYGGGTFENTLSGLWGLATLLPSIAIQMRRLHDANFSGWFWLLVFIPVLGWIALVVLSAMPSNPAGQRFDRPEATR
ncbi:MULTISPECIES: DUF805 domain-containing protein [unclassified Curtobacterium]|uniref:DUF805 domain-containing protein n=1 Tax=unclassified Curtobacterium TaxID=257496 RepID=UPI00226BAA7E|nr:MULTISPECIES: DUF805 domain-containing protein [unclassified Curtobacterium]